MDVLEPAGGPANVRRVAAGEADFCLTSVLHYLVARAEDGWLPARFVAVVGQRSPMAGLVASDSPWTVPSDLGGLRVAGPSSNRLVAEYTAWLARHEIADPVIVDCGEGGGPAALGRGDVDVVPEFADLVPRVRRQSGLDVRPIRVGGEVYANGLVAGDHVPDTVVDRMRTAIAAALERQRRAPETGLDVLCDRYPGTHAGDALEGWHLAESSVFGDTPVGAMDADRWQATLAHYATAHRLTAPEPTTVYRPDCLTDLLPSG